MNKYKIIKNLIQAREKKEVVFLFIGMLSLSIIETLGVASIVPFMAMVSEIGELKAKIMEMENEKEREGQNKNGR